MDKADLLYLKILLERIAKEDGLTIEKVKVSWEVTALPSYPKIENINIESASDPSVIKK